MEDPAPSPMNYISSSLPELRQAWAAGRNAFLEGVEVTGCTDPNAINFNPRATKPCFECCKSKFFGSTDPQAWNYQPWSTTSYPGANWMPIDPNEAGCTVPGMVNYDARAQVDDGSCRRKLYGCTNPMASNYAPMASTDDASCVPFAMGCTQPGDPASGGLATLQGGGACWGERVGSMNGYSPNYDAYATINSGQCDRENCAAMDQRNVWEHAEKTDSTCLLQPGCPSLGLAQPIPQWGQMKWTAQSDVVAADSY